jgi:hypothetical protein
MGVRTVGDLAKFKYCKWAEAMQIAAKYEEWDERKGITAKYKERIYYI